MIVLLDYLYYYHNTVSNLFFVALKNFILIFFSF